jgi:hypothetical protein
VGLQKILQELEQTLSKAMVGVVVLLALQILRYQFITAFLVVLVVVRQKVERLELVILHQLLHHKEIAVEPQAVMEAQEVVVLTQLEAAQQLLMAQQEATELHHLFQAHQ